jgi:hypothetical protein
VYKSKSVSSSVPPLILYRTLTVVGSWDTMLQLYDDFAALMADWMVILGLHLKKGHG